MKELVKKIIKKQIKKVIIGSGIGSVGGIVVIIFIVLLLVLGFFGENITYSTGDLGDGLTDPYVEENYQYVDKYIPIVNKNIREGNGYVSLSRIVYFYSENNKLTFEELYNDNLNTELKQVKPISEVCEMSKYKNMEVCEDFHINNSLQINKIQSKPFSKPIDFSKVYITSFFKQQRVVYGKSNVHEAWDLSAPDETPVYAVCDGVVKAVSFSYKNNVINVNDKEGGNHIKIECEIDKSTYSIFYAHLYPGSNLVKVGERVEQGTQIAGVGTTGYSTGSHLHFQVSRNGTTVDGMSLIKFNE